MRALFYTADGLECFDWVPCHGGTPLLAVQRALNPKISPSLLNKEDLQGDIRPESLFGARTYLFEGFSSKGIPRYVEKQ